MDAAALGTGASEAIGETAAQGTPHNPWHAILIMGQPAYAMAIGAASTDAITTGTTTMLRQLIHPVSP
jgi:hypothetical protein